MRQALGLGDETSSHRPQARFEQERRGRRFVKDGEVPVVVVNGSREGASDPSRPVNRVAAAESALRTERAARDHAERALAEALSNLQGLRTQLVHADMSHSEALAAEREARVSAETALADASATVAKLQARLDDAISRTESAAVETVQTPIVTQTAPAPRPRGRPRKIIQEMVAAPSEIVQLPRKATKLSRNLADVDGGIEQEPVKWWLPSYKSKVRSKS